jgi:hypothetical protein
VLPGGATQGPELWAHLLSWWAAQSAGGGGGGGGAAHEQLEFGVSLASHPLKGAEHPIQWYTVRIDISACDVHSTAFERMSKKRANGMPWETRALSRCGAWLQGLGLACPVAGPGGWALAFGRSRGPQLPASAAAIDSPAVSGGSSGTSSSGGSTAGTSPAVAPGGGNGSAAAAEATGDCQASTCNILKWRHAAQASPCCVLVKLLLLDRSGRKQSCRCVWCCRAACGPDNRQ